MRKSLIQECDIPSIKRPKACHFQAITTNPGACQSRRKTRSQLRVIPGDRPGIQGIYGLSAELFQETHFREYYLVFLQFLHSIKISDYFFKIAISVSFRAKNGQKRVIPGDYHQSRSDVNPDEKNEANYVSFRTQTRNPGDMRTHAELYQETHIKD